MLDERVAQLIQQGKSAAQLGNNGLAREYLQAAVDLAPDNPTGWLWLAGVLENPAEVKYALERVLELDPGNVRAQQGLAQIEQQIASQPPMAAQHLSFEDAGRGTSSLGGGGKTGPLSIEEELRQSLRSQQVAQPGTGPLVGGGGGMADPVDLAESPGGGGLRALLGDGEDMIFRVLVAALALTFGCGAIFLLLVLLGVVG